jgi:hypothetical protein
VAETLEEFHALGGRLRAVGRFHEHRRALLSGPFDVDAVAAAPRVLISAEAVPYRPNLGVYIVVEDIAPAGRAPNAGRRLEALLETPGVAGVWSFVSDDERRLAWRPGRHRITVCFLDESPLTVSSSLGEVLHRGSSGTDAVVHAGPLETITPWRWDWFDAESAPSV